MNSSAVRAEPASAGETRFLDVVFPDRANHYGTLFGGNALSLMGKAAFIAAVCRARRNVVMATLDKIDDLVEVIARVEREGRGSMAVAVEMIREDPITGLRRSVVRGSFEMVAVDDAGRPTAMRDTACQLT
jgi:acyl-CoA hydrolase